MLVSVVIPVYNGERYLAASLESVLKQTYQHFEVIVVDDGSTDGSRALLATYEPRVRVIAQRNSGVSAARNLAAASAQGELIAFLDADDLWDDGKLAAMVDLMQAHPRCLAAYHSVRLIDAAGTITLASDAEDNRWMSGDVLLGLVLGRTSNCFSPSQAIVRRGAFISAGGFPLGIRQAEDYGLWLKLAAKGPILYLCAILGSYRRHAASVSIEANNGTGRAHGRFAALVSVRDEVASRPDEQLRRVFRDELLDAARTLGWFCRQQSDWAGAYGAYKVASELAPRDISLRLLAKMMHFKSLRSVSAAGRRRT